MRHLGIFLFAVAMVFVVGCRTFTPTPMDQVGFEERA